MKNLPLFPIKVNQGCVPLGWSGDLDLRISDPRSVWIMLHQKSWQIHSSHGFTGSFDAPWSRQILDHWSWDLDHPKGMHPTWLILSKSCYPHKTGKKINILNSLTCYMFKKIKSSTLKQNRKENWSTYVAILTLENMTSTSAKSVLYKLIVKMFTHYS